MARPRGTWIEETKAALESLTAELHSTWKFEPYSEGARAYKMQLIDVLSRSIDRLKRELRASRRCLKRGIGPIFKQKKAA